MMLLGLCHLELEHLGKPTHRVLFQLQIELMLAFALNDFS